MLGNGLTGAASTAGTLSLGGFSQSLGGLVVQNDNTTVSANNPAVDTIAVASNTTLAINGPLTVGFGAANTTKTNLTLSGGGALSVGSAIKPTNANIQLGINATTNISNAGHPDLSGLSGFTAFLGTGALNVGETVNNNGTGTATSTLTLAPNSSITAATISSDSPDSDITEAIVLGNGTNVFNANTINIGMAVNRSSGTLAFQPTDTTGTLKVRNEAGTAGAVLNVGYGSSGTGAVPTANSVDLTGHSADLLLSSLNIGGRTSATAGAGVGAVFKFDTGSLSATSVTVGNRAGNAGTGATSGDLQLGGGTTTIGTGGLLIGNTSSTVTAPTVAGSVEPPGMPR